MAAVVEADGWKAYGSEKLRPGGGNRSDGYMHMEKMDLFRD